MSYDLDEHKHRFSVWTAARAVQRSFTTTAKISKAIDCTSLRQFVKTNDEINQNLFDQLHKEWCKKLIEQFEMMDLSASYGRAAKIVAIYLKTSLIFDSDKVILHPFIHPPIDRILLMSLAKENGLSNLKSINWTHLNFDNYWLLVQQIRQHFNSFDWKLEVHWTPEIEK